MYRLLVCDDAVEYRALIRTVLAQDDDFEIVGQAGHGRECLERLEEVTPDVVLLDMDMPLMNGFETLPHLRATSPETTVVVLSTAWTPELEQRALELGAVAYLEKPRNVLDLPQALRAALRGTPGTPVAPGDLVEKLIRRWNAGDREAAYALMDEQISYAPLRYDEVCCGPEAIQRFVEEVAREDWTEAEVTPFVLLERDDNVVVLAHAKVAMEHLSAAWVFRVRGERIASVTTYDDWGAAQSAAGIRADDEHTERPLTGAASR
jgi:DNA-binding NarL/FixJ family response regulator